MPERKINQVFSERLRYFLSINGMTQADLANRLGVSAATVSDWAKGKKMPRMKKIDAMCDIFRCKRSDLVEDATPTNSNQYYIDPETARRAQEAYEDPDTRILLDAKRDLSSDDFQYVVSLVKRLKGRKND